MKNEPSRELILIRVMAFCHGDDAQLAERKLLLCRPLARGESRKRDSF